MIIDGSLQASLLRPVCIRLFTSRRDDADDPVDDAEPSCAGGQTYPPQATCRACSSMCRLR
ncbi:hypothetical protein EWW49_29245, partial [Pseudomonas syringae]